MSKAIKIFAVVFLAILVAYFFLIDSLIKSQLEREGANMLQAPLAIGSVNFHLFPTSLALHNVRVGNARLPTHNLVQADELAVPLSLRDLLSHKFIVDNVDLHGVRFNSPRDEQNSAASNSTSTTQSPQLREALQRVQQMLNHPLASNTIDPNASIAGAVLADQFKPLLTQITTALNAITAAPRTLGDWQILARRVNVDGALDFGNSALRFEGTIDNVTPQPDLFDVVTQIDLRNTQGEAAILHIYGSLDKRKLAQATLRFDLHDFPLSQWPLSTDSELKIIVVSAKANIQAIVALTGNQFDLNALTHIEQAHFDIANGNDNIARVVADVWRSTEAFDINLQASGDMANPALKINSSLDVPLANAIRQLQPTAAFPQATSFPIAP